MFRTIIFKIASAIHFILWAPILLVGLVSARLSHFLVVSCARGLALLARIICGVKYQVHFPLTEENGIPMLPNGNSRFDGKAIIAAKHMSLLEIVVLSHVVPNAFFICKREIMWLPIYGWAFWRMGLLPVNRSRGKTNLKKLEHDVAKKIMDGRTLVIFPEGTRVKPGAHQPLRRGLLFLAHELRLPILPVGTDTGLYWPKHGKMTAGTANIYFEPMLPCNASLEEITEAINRHSA
ncbi:MAG: 1-acyl-sn-glycerol-3-phosphate acyltransferase [Alphaproteobacteria bacterium]|nr:1-acyl-sn-glycerol-3-phosphate acyltransferase [Alphaproteobacteria bacterium]